MYPTRVCEWRDMISHTHVRSKYTYPNIRKHAPRTMYHNTRASCINLHPGCLHRGESVQTSTLRSSNFRMGSFQSDLPLSSCTAFDRGRLRYPRDHISGDAQRTGLQTS